MFGEERLKEVLASNSKDVFQALIDSYYFFIGDQHQHDDISLIEVLAQPYETKFIRDLNCNFENQITFIPWNISLNIEPAIIKGPDVVNNIISLLPSSVRISFHFDAFRTILSELYSNALEHGLLNLSSSMKATPEGFGQYYLSRDQRLEDLTEGYVKIHISAYKEGSEIKSKIVIEDSGQGFDYLLDSPQEKESIQPWGRGISLVKSLSEKVTYSDRGRNVEVIMILS